MLDDVFGDFVEQGIWEDALTFLAVNTAVALVLFALAWVLSRFFGSSPRFPILYAIGLPVVYILGILTASYTLGVITGIFPIESILAEEALTFLAVNTAIVLVLFTLAWALSRFFGSSPRFPILCAIGLSAVYILGVLTLVIWQIGEANQSRETVPLDIDLNESVGE